MHEIPAAPSVRSATGQRPDLLGQIEVGVVAVLRPSPGRGEEDDVRLQSGKEVEVTPLRERKGVDVRDGQLSTRRREDTGRVVHTGQTDRINTTWKPGSAVKTR